jgi:hypothetical protein
MTFPGYSKVATVILDDAKRHFAPRELEITTGPHIRSASREPPTEEFFFFPASPSSTPSYPPVAGHFAFLDFFATLNLSID